MPEWKNTLPTEPGFYWLRNFSITYGPTDSRETIVELIPDPTVPKISDPCFAAPARERAKRFYITGLTYNYELKTVVKGEWCGPITPDMTEKAVMAERERCKEIIDYCSRDVAEHAIPMIESGKKLGES